LLVILCAYCVLLQNVPPSHPSLSSVGRCLVILCAYCVFLQNSLRRSLPSVFVR
jgi:hypothetical protein